MNKVLGFTIIFLGVFLAFIFQQGWIGKNNSNLIEISIVDLSEKLKSEDTIVLISSPTCSKCKILMPKIQRVLNHVDKKIYYLNIDDARIESEEDVINFLTQYSLSEAPALMHYQNGDPLYTISGNLDEKTLKSYLSF